MIAALAGGVGAARLLRGMVEVVEPAQITAVVNTGDDTELHGLYISPDLDTVTYTLAGLNDDERGWGVAGESWTVMEALARLGGETWFRLGDRDLATHLFRSDLRADGARLSEATRRLSSALGVGVNLLPMSDDPVRTRVTLVDGPEVDFQEYFVRRSHAVAVASVRFEGAATSRPAAGVLAALQHAEVVVVCPSNPIVSIGPVLAVPGVADTLAARRQSVVAVSPIVAGSALKGPADRLLAELGYASSVVGVAECYRHVVGTLVVDEADQAQVADVESLDMRCVTTSAVMHSTADAAALARVALDAGRTPASTGR
jgi:LPPG:FO 2-phospho-L-lactate transferase